MANTKDSVTSPLAAYSRWYNPDLDLSPSTRHLLETYSHISIDEVDSHLHAVVSEEKALLERTCIADQIASATKLGRSTRTHVLAPGAS